MNKELKSGISSQRILLTNKKEKNDKCNNLEGTQGNYAAGKRQSPKVIYCMIPLM